MSNNIEKLAEVVKKLTKSEIEVLENALGELKKSMESVELSSLNPGETFKIGKFDFIVLEHKDGKTMVISKGFLAENIVFDSNNRDYNKSNLKKLIDSDILPVIEKEVGAENIIEHEVDLTSVDMKNEFCSCKCKVRPLTFDEARVYNEFLPNEELNDWWWTCTPWSTKERGCEYSIAVVSSRGYVYGSCCIGYYGGVRPFCILKSNIFVSKGE